MRVLVAGPREYPHWQKVHTFLDALHARYGITKIIQGCARGVDFAAWTWANLNGVAVTGDEYKPDWDGLGKKAGIVRNEDMHDAEVPHLVVGFCPTAGRGTSHMVQYATQRGTPTMCIPDPEWEALQMSLVVEQDALADEVEILHTKPYWLKEPGPKDRWHRRVIVTTTPADRYDADTLF